MLKFIKEYFNLGLYKESDLDIFVTAKWISEEEKEDIIKSKVVTQ
ncbi:XkdX family protein [Clostridium phage CWou-2020a]|nr:XkdX family protein [Clostridium botulinum]QPW59456.1 XkdX family protein [Clostridium phage CWou-2020a]MCD3240927.1 XkdX family protein [Clostridium botulinum D/C]MCD3299778.1 XkdX family protein [Clostridium botulinum D/C]MCD3306432.1 XkdX family protein [Clostridium botulinum D/C]MCD3315957.1 XkdX family protein [Clostridium botulinum D/C]